jgi:excisionase family DNA binding protein
MTAVEKAVINNALASLQALGQISKECLKEVCQAISGEDIEVDKYISMKEACKRSGYCRKTISRYIEDGSLQCRKTARGSIRIPASEIDKVFGLQG